MTTSLWNVWRYSHASLATRDARLGVVAVDVEDRRLDRLGDVGAVQRRAGVLRRGREADLVVDDQVDRAADAVAADVAHRQALGDDALAGERGVAVDEHRQHGERSRRARSGPAGRGPCPCTIGSTVSRWLGLAASSTRMSAPDGLTYLPVTPRWYLTSPEPCTVRRVDVALELGEDRLVALAHDVGQHVEPAAVGHAERRRASRPASAALGEDLVEDRDRRLGALDAEPLRADVLRGEELLERLGGVQALEDAVLLLLGRRRAARSRPWLWIQRCSSVFWMCMYSTPIVRQYASRSTPSRSPRRILSTPPTPSVRNSRSRSQIVRPYVAGSSSTRRVRLLPAQRVEVGDQVAADAVDADELGDRHLLARASPLRGRSGSMSGRHLTASYGMPRAWKMSS